MVGAAGRDRGYMGAPWIPCLAAACASPFEPRQRRPEGAGRSPRAASCGGSSPPAAAAAGFGERACRMRTKGSEGSTMCFLLTMTVPSPCVTHTRATEVFLFPAESRFSAAEGWGQCWDIPNRWHKLDQGHRFLGCREGLVLAPPASSFARLLLFRGSPTALSRRTRFRFPAGEGFSIMQSSFSIFKLFVSVYRLTLQCGTGGICAS